MNNEYQKINENNKELDTKVFKKLGSSVVSVNILKKSKIEDQVNQLIKNNHFKMVVDLMSSGYELTKKQKTTIYNDKDAHKTLDFLDLMVDKKLHIDDSILLKQYGKILHHFNHTLIFNYLTKRFKESDLKDRIFIEIKKEVKRTYIKSLINYTGLGFGYVFGEKDAEQFRLNALIPLNNTYNTFFLKFASLNDHFELISNLEKVKGIFSYHKYNCLSIENSIKLIQKSISNNCNDELDITKKSIEINASKENLENNLLEKSLNEIKTKNLKDLPEEALELLDGIEKQYIKLIKKENELTEENKFNLNNLWNKKLPEVIGKFLSIDSEYRLELKNTNGKNAQELMVDSLISIYDNINKLVLLSEDKKLTDLSVVNRHIKSIKLK